MSSNQRGDLLWLKSLCQTLCVPDIGLYYLPNNMKLFSKQHSLSSGIVQVIDTHHALAF